MNLKKELSNSQTMLLVMPSSSYNKEIIKVMKQLSGKKVIYVTLNKTYESLIEIFKKNKIDTNNVIYVDAISKTIKNKPKKVDNCCYISSPGALVELSLIITKLLKHNFEYLIFDSLNSLLVYEKKTPVAKVLQNLINKIKQSDTKAIYYALYVRDKESLIQESSMFVDKVIKIGGK